MSFFLFKCKITLDFPLNILYNINIERGRGEFKGMKYYQIYVKHVRLDGTKAKKFRKAGFQNRFFNIEDAKKRVKELEDAWSIHGVEYKIVTIREKD